MQGTEKVTEFKVGKATVRMHGTPDREKLEAATRKFMERVLAQKRKQERSKGGEPDVLHG